MRRLTYIENRRVLADSGEITIDIDVRDPITALWIEFRATNGASGNQDNPLVDCLTSVDLIDGGKVLWSLDGYELFAETAYRLGHIPSPLIGEIVSMVQNVNGLFMFGRWFGDQQYAFDPSKFSNPQLRFKWNLSATRTVAATAYATGTGRLTVFADVMEGAPSPQAMITARELYSFTTAASGKETIDLPVDMRLKALILRSASDSGSGLYGISNIKVTGDNDKFVALDMGKTDLQRWMTLHNKAFSYKHGFLATSGDTIYTALKLTETLVALIDSGDTVIGYYNVGKGSSTITMYTAGSVDTADKVFWAEVTGYCPWNTAYVEMGEWDDPATWLDATVFNKLKLELTQDVASSEAAVVIEQEYVY
jgi:hypothetical protein